MTQSKFSVHKSVDVSWIAWDVPSLNYLYKLNLCAFKKQIIFFTVNCKLKSYF